MSGVILAQNVTRMANENETLKRENADKAAKIEALEERIRTLLEKNEKYI